MATLAYPEITHDERVARLRELMGTLSSAIDLDTATNGGTKGNFFEVANDRVAFMNLYPRLWGHLKKLHIIIYGGNFPANERLEAFDNVFQDYIVDTYEDVCSMGCKSWTELALAEWTMLYRHLNSWTRLVGAALEGFEPEEKEGVFERAKRIGTDFFKG